MRRILGRSTLISGALAISLSLPSPIFAQTAITECDRLASDPLDDERLAPAVPDPDVDRTKAEAACRGALAAAPADPRSAFQLGRVLLLSNNPEGSDLIRSAADNDYAAAIVYLGDEIGALTPETRQRRFEVYLRAAELGNTQAQYLVGISLYTGIGTQRDFEQAFLWCKKAARKNHPAALFALATQYNLGRGVAKNTELASKYLRLSAELGFAAAQHVYGKRLMYGPNTREAGVKYIERAATQDWRPAMLELGAFYYDGLFMPRDTSKARYWLCKAGEPGRRFYQEIANDVLHCDGG